jgi:heat shock protein HslJ
MRAPLRLLLIGSTLIAIAVLGAACGSDDDDEPSGSTGRDGTPATAEDLEGTNWQLKSYTTGSGDALTAASAEADATVEFDGSQASGTTGCNNFNGGYELSDDGAISFGPMASTKKACSDELNAQEAAVFSGFEDAARAEVADGDLQLLDSSGDVLLIFGS